MTMTRDSISCNGPVLNANGAGLDVTDPEPLPPNHELWTLPNVIISPHVSSTTDRDEDRRWLVMRENLRRYINGEKLLNVVDKNLGC